MFWSTGRMLWGPGREDSCGRFRAQRRMMVQRLPRFRVAIILAVLMSAAPCTAFSQALTAKRAAQVTEDVKTFARTVAHDVTEEGPSAWRRHFADTPSFFMASEGRLVFPNSAAASRAIQELSRKIKSIELRWGDDLRVDPLTPDLAVVATTYHETRMTFAGQRAEEDGYFTGVAQYRSGRWQFRDAHWSVAVPASPVP